MGTDRAPLDTDALRSSLRPPWSGLKVVVETESTNADLVAAAASLPTGTVLAAENQRAGRGRLDRTWTSPPGAGLTFSVLLRPKAPMHRWGWLPLLTGLAVCDAVAARTGLDAKVKWPNDVLLTSDEHKVAGILAQVSGDAVVIGIGLNVNLRPDELPVPTATSLLIASGGPVDRTELLCEVLGELGGRFQLWDDAGGHQDAAGLGADYTDHCATLGREVTVSQLDGPELRGVAEAIDEDGALVLRLGSGPDAQRRRIAAGDVQHLR